MILNEIVEYIRENRVSTTEVADALGKTGHLAGPLPLTEGLHKVGPIRCLFVSGKSNFELHQGAREVNPGEVVVVFSEKTENLAILGELVSRYLLLYRKAEAVVVCGLVRDAPVILRERYAVWATGVTPIGMFNQPSTSFPRSKAEEIRAKFEGGIAICDDSGVVLIERQKVSQSLTGELEEIEMMEDVWHFCLDTLKWDTKRIVCDRDYETEPSVVALFKSNQKTNGKN